jgi:uncharacterized LabA/DUF88 family protein
MFKPFTKKLAGLAGTEPKVIKELESLLKGKTFMYIDYANVRPWSEKLGWHIDLKRLKQFLNSFQNIGEVKFYSGTLEGDSKSEEEVRHIREAGYLLRTKPVKIMRLSIDTKSIPSLEDKALLKQFIRRALLRKYTGETIEYLNRRFAEMNAAGERFIEDRKCNFDVEIGVDMLLDDEKKKFETCVLWSGDSDFYDPTKKLLAEKKQVILFSTARKVSKELNELKKEGLVIFDIQKIKTFICWKRELAEQIAKEPPTSRDSKH